MERRKFIGLSSLMTAGMLIPSHEIWAKSVPGKDWKVFIFNATHMDIGWHDLPAPVMEKIAGYLDQTIELCEKSKDATDGLQYVYTIEHAWIVDYYEKHRTKEQVKRLIDCIKRGQMDIGAFYASVHTDLCGHEELARLSFYASQLRKKYNIPVEYAMLNDVSEGYTMGMPQLLSKSGINGVCFGPGVKAVIKGIAPRVPRIAYWQTIDGSKIMLAWTPGFWTYNIWSAGMKGQKTIDEFNQLSDYPYDAFFRHGGRGDIQPPNPKLLDEVKKYREECKTKNIKMATMSEFFGYIKKNFDNKIPVVKGDCPQSWADGTNSLALETGLHKRNQHDIISAETLAALYYSKDYPKNQIQEVYNNLHLYSDHTWGYDFDPDGRPGEIRKVKRGTTHKGDIEFKVSEGSELTPKSEFFNAYREHWQAKKDYVYKAKQITDGILTDSLQFLTNKINVNKDSIVVWNPMSFKRTDYVKILWKESFTPSALIDVRDNERLPCQIETDDNNQRFLFFIAVDMPPVGYCVFEIEKGDLPEVKKEKNEFIENEFYKIKIDPKTATLLSVYDKDLKKEIIDTGAAYSFNQYIHADVNAGFNGTGGAEKAGIAYGEGTRYIPNIIENIECINGPVFSSFEANVKLTQGPAPATIKHIVRIYNKIKKIDIVNIVTKEESLYKEQIYMAFPFNTGCNPKFILELPYAMLHWDKDILPGGWRGYGSVQNFVQISGNECSVAWSSPETPVATFGGLNSNHWDAEWHESYVPSNGHIYSYAMSNMWNCNYPLFQGGRAEFPYSFTTARHMTLAESAKFGWGTAHPLSAVIAKPHKGGASAKPYNALNLDKENVIVTTLKKAEDGKGWIIRLYEINQDPVTKVSLHINFAKIKSAQLCMISEENLRELPLIDNAVKVELKSNELVSIRIM